MPHITSITGDYRDLWSGGRGVKGRDTAVVYAWAKKSLANYNLSPSLTRTLQACGSNSFLTLFGLFLSRRLFLGKTNFDSVLKVLILWVSYLSNSLYFCQIRVYTEFTLFYFSLINLVQIFSRWNNNSMFGGIILWQAIVVVVIEAILSKEGSGFSYTIS